MHCNKRLVTQPPFLPMGLDRDAFHICRLPHIFHFSISVDLRAAFIQLTALAFALFSGLEPNSCCHPPVRLNSYSLRSTLVDLLGLDLLALA